MELNIKKKLIPKLSHFRCGAQKLFFSNLGPKTHQAISPEPQLIFSQRRPHFVQNHKLNPTKLSILKKYINLWVRPLKSCFGPFGLNSLNPICTGRAQIFAPLWKITQCMSNFEQFCGYALLTFNNFLGRLRLLN